MTMTTLFLAGLVATAAFSAAVVLYLKRPLRQVLTELCGTEERADFWKAISLVCMTLMPIIFAMSYKPDASGVPIVEIASQVKGGLAGLLSAVIVIAFILSSYISRNIVGVSRPRPAEPGRGI